MRNRELVGGGWAATRRAFAIGCAAALIAAMAPGAASAWSGSGAETGAAGPAIGGPAWGDAQAAASVPMLGVSDRLGFEIAQFSQPHIPGNPWMGHEMVHWAQMMTVVAATTAAIAEAMQRAGGGGGKGVLGSAFGPIAPPIASDVSPTPAPEPRSIWLFALSSALILTAFARRRARAAAAVQGERGGSR
jgi:hypothetical protein